MEKLFCLMANMAKSGRLYGICAELRHGRFCQGIVETRMIERRIHA
ncbi:hypothetical protein AOR13_3932 [Alteromonas stellipolaris LMG 21856]|nr:hypothetical protein AOR13_3932 [Alteromonas stellipolaris LMG 21856]